MEYREGPPIHVRHTGLLAATILVHEPGRVLPQRDHLPMGTLRQARRTGVRYLASERQPKHQWPKQSGLSILVRQAEYYRAVLIFFHVLHHTGATAAVRSEIAKASSNEIVHC